MVDGSAPHRVFKIDELTMLIANQLIILTGRKNGVSLACACRCLEEPDDVHRIVTRSRDGWMVSSSYTTSSWHRLLSGSVSTSVLCGTITRLTTLTEFSRQVAVVGCRLVSPPHDHFI